MHFIVYKGVEYEKLTSILVVFNIEKGSVCFPVMQDSVLILNSIIINEQLMKCKMKDKGMCKIMVELPFKRYMIV